MSEWRKVGVTSGFPEGRATSITVDGKTICVAHAAGAFWAFDDRCTHAESLLSVGGLEGDGIICPLHGARFSIKTGEALTLPAVKPVRIYDVKVEGNDVLINLGGN